MCTFGLLDVVHVSAGDLKGGSSRRHVCTGDGGNFEIALRGRSPRGMGAGTALRSIPAPLPSALGAAECIKGSLRQAVTRSPRFTQGCDFRPALDPLLH